MGNTDKLLLDAGLHWAVYAFVSDINERVLMAAFHILSDAQQYAEKLESLNWDGIELEAIE